VGDWRGEEDGLVGDIDGEGRLYYFVGYGMACNLGLIIDKEVLAILAMIDHKSCKLHNPFFSSLTFATSIGPQILAFNLKYISTSMKIDKTK